MRGIRSARVIPLRSLPATTKAIAGEVQQVIRKKNKDGSYDPNRVYVIVAGANLVIKHQRRTPNVGTQTGRIEMEAPIHISNVMLVGTDGRPTRAGYEVPVR